ncbi:MAG: DUF3298 and DUF4163 domain-containing protein [Clostridia bacterium]|nr:DUF3298 and DUF4163 domain-containing protein [Clostridia bacterium]
MTYSKWQKIGLLCLGAALAVSVSGCSFDQTTTQNQQEPVEIEVSQEQTQPIAKKIAVEAEPINEDTVAYTVEVTLPVISGFSDQAFETSLNQGIKDAANDFIEAIKAMALDVQEDGYLTSPYHAGIEYTVLNNSDSYLSVELFYNEYTGGAHGNYYSEYINCDVQNEKILALKDIMKPDEPYMKVLNEAITEAIEKERSESEYGEELHPWYEGVTEETLTFSIQEEGLGIHFQPYEIGPYAEGAPSYVIPYEKLSDVLSL